MDPGRRLTFRRSQRLTMDRQYRSVYDARVRKAAGPLIIFGAPNEAGHARLGLSVPRKVGTAVLRNRIKRLLRESFRLGQHELPAYDYVVNVRPHTPLPLERYGELLSEAAAQIRREWERRRRREVAGEGAGEGGGEGGGGGGQGGGGAMMRTLLALPFILAIRAYQVVLAPFIGGSCRFFPTCSEYAIEAYRRHNPVRGTWLTARRLLRCHPWGGEGFDPVPEPPNPEKSTPNKDCERTLTE